MSIGDTRLDVLLEELAPVLLPPAEYPPADIVRDTPREELIDRIENNAEVVGLDIDDKHLEVINFLFDFYENCCETKAPHYLGQKGYWEYIDCVRHHDCDEDKETVSEKCPFGQLSVKEATKAYRVYRILLKAFKNKGGKKYLYKLFPYGPLFTIHLLAQLPRLINDVDPHFGTAY